MDDTFKWSLIALFSGIFIFLGGLWLGIDWMTVQTSMLSFIVLLGQILILFTGSAAAIEAARYFRKKNRLIDQKEERLSARREEELRLQEMMTHAIAESLAPIHEYLGDVKAELDQLEQHRRQSEQSE